MRGVTAILFAAVLFGCTTTGSGGRDVRLTRDAADVAHCKHIGAVQSVPPYTDPGEDFDQIRSQTVAIGADTVLLNKSRKVSTSGIAYRCRTS
jgi:hypothetical protein